MSEEEKPGWAQGVTVRTLTPEIRDQVLSGWSILSVDPIDHFTPRDSKESAYPPVFHIRKPSYLDSLRELQKNPEAAKQLIAARRAAKAQEGAEVLPPTDDQTAKDMEAQGLAMVEDCREYLTGWDWKTPFGEPIPFSKGPDGKISDDSLATLARAWRMMMEIHFRVKSLRVLSDLEVEGFTSSPGSVTG